MRKKIIMVCDVCLSRNYSTYKNKDTNTERLEQNKHCPRCNAHTLHKETR